LADLNLFLGREDYVGLNDLRWIIMGPFKFCSDTNHAVCEPENEAPPRSLMESLFDVLKDLFLDVSIAEAL
jgi:hypothetical protein